MIFAQFSIAVGSVCYFRKSLRRALWWREDEMHWGLALETSSKKEE